MIGAVRVPWGDTPDPFLRYLRDQRILNPYTPSKGPIDFSYYHTCNVSTSTHALLSVGGFNENFKIYGMEDIELGYRLQKAGSRMVFAEVPALSTIGFPEYADFMERSEQAGYSLGYLLRLHPELKQRFVESSRFLRRLKSVHSLYKWANAAIWRQSRTADRLGKKPRHWPVTPSDGNALQVVDPILLLPRIPPLLQRSEVGSARSDHFGPAVVGQRIPNES